MAGVVSGPTLKTTWALQFEHRNGAWYHNDQGEYATPEDAIGVGNQMFGGGAIDNGWGRLVRIDRTPMALVDGDLVEVQD